MNYRHLWVAAWLALSFLHERSVAAADASAVFHAGAAQPAAESREAATSIVTGCVLLPNGRPCEGGMVVSSAGGRSVTHADGGFRLVVERSGDGGNVHVTAIAGSGGANLRAHSELALSSGGAANDVGTMILEQMTACDPSWLPTFGEQAAVDDEILALAVWDDELGGGPALYVGGRFERAGGQPIDYLAKWDGTRWSEVGGGAYTVRALTVFDDGTGSALYAGGDFTVAGGIPANRIARWDGTAWSALGGGLDNRVQSLAVFDDGSGAGPALYAGGHFVLADGQAANGIAKWNGSSWSPLGSGLSGGTAPACWALGTFDDGSGSGPALYVGGSFSDAGGAAASNVAKWDGSGWSALGSGVNATVHALLGFDDGGGPRLYAGGRFNVAGGVTARSIARWDGMAWSPVGAGFSSGSTETTVYALGVFDLGDGPSLYASGALGHSASVSVHNIARWNGSAWSALGAGTDGKVNAMVLFDDGQPGAAIYVGGTFGEAGGIFRPRFAKWTGSSWPPVGRGLNGDVHALAAFDDGTGGGSELYAGGAFTAAGGLLLNHVAKWDGDDWSPLGSGLGGGEVYDFAVFDDGSGSGLALYAAGRFTSPGLRVAKWTGSAWAPLGEGVGYPGWDGDRVLAIEAFDDGSGPALFAGGCFTAAGGRDIRYLARWDGAGWSGVGSGPNVGPNNCVAALAVYEENGVEHLFAGGSFGGAGGVVVDCIARWNGTSWSNVGGGMHPQDSVYALGIYDDGGGSALYVGGYISQAGSISVNGIAKWDGSAWSALGSGLSSWGASTMAVFDDGCGAGPMLYAGGSFSSAGGQTARDIARWDGSSWSPVGSGTDDGSVSALVVFDDGSGGGPALYAGGSFTGAIDSSDSFLALWGHVEFPTGSAYCSGDGSATPCPCGNAGAAGAGCANSSGMGATLRGEGSSSVAADELVLIAEHALPNQPALLFSADNAVNGGAGIAFGDGLRCAGGNVLRLGVALPDGSGVATWGPGLSAQGAFQPGATRRFQVWYRDPTSSPCGQGFNLSNGYAVLFIR